MAQKKKTAPARAKRTRKAPAKRKSSWLATIFAAKYSKPLAFMAIFAIIGVGTLLYTMAATPATTYIQGIGGKCLDNYAQKVEKGNKIELWTCNKGPAQRWDIKGDGTIRLNANPAYCLDVKNRGITSKTPVWLWPCNGTVAQQWKSVNGTIVYNNPDAKPQLCLDDAGGKTDDGNPIWIYQCNGTAAQQWKAVKTDNGSVPAPGPNPPSSGNRKHFAPNAGPSDANKIKALGYNLVDVGPDTGEINGLPSGMQAMVWVGGWRCEPFSTSLNAFKTFVNNNRNNAKIYGYYIYDEVESGKCPGRVGEIKTRADFIHCLSNDASRVNAAGQCLDDGRVTSRRTNKKAFIVDEYNFDIARVSQSKTHVDLFGIDPYPCRPGSGCKFSGSPDYFRERISRAKQHYSQASIVPVYQAFGGDGWRVPTASEMRTILSEFDKNLSGTVMDVSYTWKRNTSGQNASLSESSGLQQVLKEHNAKY